MVSEVHRFLGRVEPSSLGKRHYVVQGAGVTDHVYHDMYHGCVVANRSVELWALEHWGGDPDRPVVIVRLTNTGDLDFDGNPDPDASRALFDVIRSPRPLKYGQRRIRPQAPSDEAAASSVSTAETRAAAQLAADAVSESVDGGQGLLNRMNQIAAALRSTGPARILVLVDDLGGQLEELEARDQTLLVIQISNVLKRHWLREFDPNTALIFYLDPERKLSNVIPRVAEVDWWEVTGPKAPEIGEAIKRVDAQTPLHISHAGGIAKALEIPDGSLRTALHTVARTFENNHEVTLTGVLDLPCVDEAAADAVLAELDALVGLDDVKSSLVAMRATARRRRVQIELEGTVPEESMHMVLLGSPGTGKTTVARIIARYFHALGLLPTGAVQEVTPSSLTQESLGATKVATVKLIAASVGGVLFIDEAQQLAKSENNPQADEVIAALVPASWNHRGNLVIILAGYAEGLSDASLERMDAGLPSRFPAHLRFELPDYNAEQLWEVVRRDLASRHLAITPAAETRLRRLIERRAARGGFGNARGALQLSAQVRANHTARTDDADRLLTEDDLPPRFRRHPEVLAEARRELDRLQGLETVKEAVRRVEVGLEYTEIDEDEEPPLAGRYLYVGPPGTGKTTVARLVGDLFYGMGLLESPGLEQVDGPGLKGDHIGQTALNVKNAFDKARGKVLFIDEAHGLIPMGEDSYARDAITSLVAQLTLAENQHTVVILAGYPAEIDRLMRSDPGLRGRFSSRLVFEPLRPDGCVAVAREMLAHMEPPMTVGDDFFEVLADKARIAVQDADFASSRWVRDEVVAAVDAMKDRAVTDHRQGGTSVVPRHLIAADLGVHEATRSSARVEAGPWQDESFLARDATLPVPAGPVPRPLSDVARTVADSVLHLLVSSPRGRATGTGFMVTADNVVLTNQHLVEDATSIEVLLGCPRGSAPARVVAHDADLDLALIVVDIPEGVDPIAPLPLAPSHLLARLHELVVIGNGQVAIGEESRTVTARVGRNRAADPRNFETDGAIEEGFSGGPLYDVAQGGVVGVVQGGRGRSVKVVIRAENALSMLEGLGYRTQEED